MGVHKIYSSNFGRKLSMTHISGIVSYFSVQKVLENIFIWPLRFLRFNFKTQIRLILTFALVVATKMATVAPRRSRTAAWTDCCYWRSPLLSRRATTYCTNSCGGSTLIPAHSNFASTWRCSTSVSGSNRTALVTRAPTVTGAVTLTSRQSSEPSKASRVGTRRGLLPGARSCSYRSSSTATRSRCRCFRRRAAWSTTHLSHSCTCCSASSTGSSTGCTTWWRKASSSGPT